MDILQEAMQSVEGRAIARREIHNLMKGYPLYQSLSVLIGAAIDLATEKGMGREQTTEIVKRVLKEVEW